MKTKFIAVITACLFLAIGAVAGGHGHDKGDKDHGHHHEHPNHYAAPCGEREHP